MPVSIPRRQLLQDPRAWALCIGVFYCALLLALASILNTYEFKIDGRSPDPYFLHGFVASFSALPALARWDSVWYLAMAQEGYWGYGPRSPYLPAFFPLYSLLLRSIQELTGVPDAYAGIAVSFICFLAALCFLVTYLQNVWSCNLSQIRFALLLLLAYPTAFLMLSVYYCSLFFLLVTMTLLYVRQDRYLAAAVTAFLAGLTHLHAAALGAALLVYALQHRRWQNYVPLLALGFAIGALFLHHWIYFGDPLYYLQAKKFFNLRLGGPLAAGQTFWDLILRRLRDPRLYHASELTEYALLLFSLLAIGRVCRMSSARFLPEAAVLAVLVGLQLVAGNSWGFTRFLLCWPIFFAIVSRYLQSKIAFALLLLVSAGLQLLNLVRWIAWNQPSL